MDDQVIICHEYISFPCAIHRPVLAHSQSEYVFPLPCQVETTKVNIKKFNLEMVVDDFSFSNNPSELSSLNKVSEILHIVWFDTFALHNYISEIVNQRIFINKKV